MFVALDSNDQRVYADSIDSGVECFCPACGEPLRLRSGKIRKPHFAHLPNTDCFYGLDKDYKSEWHVRMQEYFPRESREVRFKDEKTGEIHIADVFLPSKNTVLEFQHSPISEEEFMSRTAFHINSGRRIVWFFDESTSSTSSESVGRFRADDSRIVFGPYERLYSPRTYKWLRNPRKFLAHVPRSIWTSNGLSICVFTGTEGDVFHRIIAQDFDFEIVVFSLNSISISENLDPDVFFRDEAFWQSQEPWKEVCNTLKARYDAAIALQKAIEARANAIMQQSLVRGYSRPRRRRRF